MQPASAILINVTQVVIIKNFFITFYLFLPLIAFTIATMINIIPMMIIIGNAINMAINSSKRNTIKPIQAIPIRNKKNNEIISVTVLS